MTRYATLQAELDKLMSDRAKAVYGSHEWNIACEEMEKFTIVNGSELDIIRQEKAA